MAVLVGVLNGKNLNRDFNFQSLASAIVTPGVRQNYDNELEVTLNQVDTGMAFVQVTRDNVSPSEVFLVPVRVTQATVVDTSGNGWIIVRVDEDKVLDGSANSVDGTGVATVEKVAALPLDDFYVILATLAGGVITDARSWSRISEYVEPDVVHYDEDAGANDSYAVTINGISELVDGMEVTFKANTANTDAATLNVNGLGAKAIRIRTSDVLVTDDIKSGSIITVRYDADNDWWQMMTPSNDVPPVPTKASQAEAEAGSDDAKYMTPLKTLQAIVANRLMGGDSSDGAIDGSADITIAGSNDTLIIKDYTSIAAAQGGGKTFTITPTGCVLWIRVRGNADLTDWTFNFNGKGGRAGNNGSGIQGGGGPGTIPYNSSHLWTAPTAPGGYGGAKNDGDGLRGDGGVAVAAERDIAEADLEKFILSRTILYCGGIGGGGGGSGIGLGAGSNEIVGTAGGLGGTGGGCVIIEVLGDLTFSTTVINIEGTNGANGGAQSSSGGSNFYASGAGGGGAGGLFLALYGGTLTGSPTVNKAGGDGGTGGVGTSGAAHNPGGGGAGGGNLSGKGTNGANSNTIANDGGAGGDGKDGLSAVIKNTVFY